MSQPYVGEIRMFGGNFAPVGWSFCNGSLQPIDQYTALFQLIGTTYGGDGQSTFGLPDLQGRLPFHQGGSFIIGQKAGTETVSLTTQQLPSHSHLAMCSNNGTATSNPGNALWLNWASNQYTDQPLTSTMLNGAMQPTGGNQPHDNLMPFLTVNFIIALYGVYPSQ
jgi:microcystin-dependent protein